MTRGKQSFLGGAALLTVTMLVTKAIGALYKIPLGNLLDEQGMNYFYAAYNIYNLLLMVSTAGLPLALSRLVSQAEALGWVNRRRRIVSVAFWLFLLLGLLSSGLMFFLAGDLAGWMHNTRAEDAIRVLSPAVLCVCLVSVIRGYTQGMGDMRPTAASEVIESASKLMVGLGLAWWLLRQGYPSHIAAAGAIAGVTAGVILSLLALTVWTATHLSRDKGRDDPGQSRDILRQLLAIGVPITVGSVSLSVINLLDQSITMGILQTSWGLTEAEAGSLYGVYSYAGNLFALPAAFIYPLTISLIPAIGAALARGDRSAARRHTAAAIRLTALLALPAHVKNGYIRRDPTKPRAIEILDDNFNMVRRELVNVPVVGRVAAGEPILATENVESYFPIPAEYVPKNPTFMLTVKGDSMINAGIFSGDHLLIEQKSTAENGEIIVALLDDSATVKTFYKEDGHYRLQPQNDAMEPIITDDVQILGKVIGVFRFLH